MAELSDAVVRAAALARVRQLRDQHAGRIPRAALLEGVSLGGRRVPLWNYQRGIYKPAVFGPLGAALSIHTSAASPYDDLHDAGAGHIVYRYQGDDPAHRDNVALKRAMDAGLPLIYLVATDPGYYDALLPVYVTACNDTALAATLVADQMESAAVGDSAFVTLRREYITRGVLARLHQQQFRRMVLTAYGERCAICRLAHVELLDAAHILPDRHPRGEPIVTNGLGLCKIHHSAYDAHIIGIDPETRVHVREDILREKDGPMLRHGLQEVAGSRLLVPRAAALRPNREFLAERFDKFRAA